MQAHTIAISTPSSERSAAWGAVLSMSLCVFVLIASEFLPVSLLTPIARDLAMTEGQAGQAIAVSGIFAVITSLLISQVTARIDRKRVLLSLTGLMAVSGAVTAFAPNYAVLMIGRALLGICIGGFWSMSTATVMRLVPENAIPKALAILNGGNALAATIAAPLGSFLGAFIGWRGAFFCVVPLAAAALGWQLTSLPALPGERRETRSVFRLLGETKVALGMAAILFLFMGQFALFTYLRPFLEQVTHVDVSTLSLILLVIGVTGLVGTMLVGLVLKSSVFGTLIVIPLLMAGIAVSLIVFGHGLIATALLLGAWGFIGTPAPVGWGTWLSRTLPGDAEAGGGLMVATIQFAITLGAATGGFLFDARRLPGDLRAQCRSLGSGCGTRIRCLARGFNISGNSKLREIRLMKTTMFLLAAALLTPTAPLFAQGGTMQGSLQAVSPALGQYTEQSLLGDVWNRPGLSKRDRSVVTLAALVSRNQTIELPRYLNLALDSGVKPAEISELITHLAFYTGWANAVGAASAAKDVFEARKIGPDQLPPASPKPLPLDEKAEAVRAARVGEQFGAMFPGVVRNTTEMLFKDLWLRPDLAPRDRSLVTVSALIATGQVPQISYHLNRAMDSGLTQAEVGESLAQLAFYSGWPTVFSAMPVVKEVFEKRGKQ